VLKAAAAELNQFQGDGSFMDQFQQQQAQQQRREGEEARPAAAQEVQPSGSDSEDEQQQQQQYQQGRPSMATAMAAERASLAARPPAVAAAPTGGGDGGGGGGQPPAAAAAGDGRVGGNLSVAAMLRARLTGKAPPATAAAAAPGECLCTCEFILAALLSCASVPRGQLVLRRWAICTALAVAARLPPPAA
jgi:hypothetical protein